MQSDEVPPVGTELIALPKGPCISWRSWRLGGDQCRSSGMCAHSLAAAALEASVKAG